MTIEKLMDLVLKQQETINSQSEMIQFQDQTLALLEKQNLLLWVIIEKKISEKKNQKKN